jgi:hypothetical protein
VVASSQQDIVASCQQYFASGQQYECERFLMAPARCLFAGNQHPARFLFVFDSFFVTSRCLFFAILPLSD